MPVRSSRTVALGLGKILFFGGEASIAVRLVPKTHSSTRSNVAEIMREEASIAPALYGPATLNARVEVCSEPPGIVQTREVETSAHAMNAASLAFKPCTGYFPLGGGGGLPRKRNSTLCTVEESDINRRIFLAGASLIRICMETLV